MHGYYLPSDQHGNIYVVLVATYIQSAPGAQLAAAAANWAAVGHYSSDVGHVISLTLEMPLLVGLLVCNFFFWQMTRL